MKIKRQKSNKKAMQLYTLKFGFRLPYQVLLDGNFVHSALKMKSDLVKNLSKTMLGTIKPMTTSCVCAELYKLGLKETAAFYKTFERKFCSHSPALSGAECIKSIIGSENKNRYAVATLDKTLRVELAQIPGVPLVYINKSVYIQEPPSQASIQKSEQIDAKKLNASEIEKKMVDKVAPTSENDALPLKRKKKGPNPLSVKKKKISLSESTKSNQSTRTRKRRSRKDSENSKENI